MKEFTTKTVGSRLNRALWTLINALNQGLKEGGIDLQHSQYIVMRVLFEREGVSQNEIAAQLHKDAAAIKRSIDYLEKKGFVVRQPLSGCKYGIYLTDYGREMQPKIIAISDEVTNRALAGISEETRQHGLEFLEAIINMNK